MARSFGANSKTAALKSDLSSTLLFYQNVFKCYLPLLTKSPRKSSHSKASVAWSRLIPSEAANELTVLLKAARYKAILAPPI